MPNEGSMEINLYADPAPFTDGLRKAAESVAVLSLSLLTPKQLALSQFVAEYHAAHGLGLSAGDIASHCHISRSVARRRVERLIALGALTRIAGKPNTITPGPLLSRLRRNGNDVNLG